MKTTARFLLSTLLVVAAAACGGPETDDLDPANPNAPEEEVEQTPEVPEPEVTPETTPEPTPTPNARPFAPLFAISDDVVSATETVIIDLTLADPDNDLLLSECHAFITSTDPETPVDEQLAKVSETQYTFLAPITESLISTAVFRCTATDEDGEASDLAESEPITIDTKIHEFEDWRNYDLFDLCRENPAVCRMQALLGDVLDVQIPDPTDIPDQITGARIDMPQGHFTATVDVAIEMVNVDRALSQTQLPSIAVTFGANDEGYGYLYEVRAIRINGAIQWRAELRALTARGLRGDTYLEGVVLATANLGKFAPTSIDVSYVDGRVQFGADGVAMPAVNGSNLATSSLAFSTRAASAVWSAPSAAMMP